MPGDIIFNIFPIFFFIIFTFIMFMFITAAVKGINQWNYNNKQPILNVDAKVISKRTNISTHHHTDNDGFIHNDSTTTTYYITFEVKSGDRMEFQVSDREYGMLVENDVGELKFQGTRYLGFTRN